MCTKLFARRIHIKVLNRILSIKLNEIDIGYKCGIFFSVCVSRLYKSILLTYITCRAPIEIQPIMTHFYYRRGSIPCTQGKTGIRRSAKIGVMLCDVQHTAPAARPAPRHVHTPGRQTALGSVHSKQAPRTDHTLLCTPAY